MTSELIKFIGLEWNNKVYLYLIKTLWKGITDCLFQDICLQNKPVLVSIPKLLVPLFITLSCGKIRMVKHANQSTHCNVKSFLGDSSLGPLFCYILKEFSLLSVPFLHSLSHSSTYSLLHHYRPITGKKLLPQGPSCIESNRSVSILM